MARDIVFKGTRASLRAAPVPEGCRHCALRDGPICATLVPRLPAKGGMRRLHLNRDATLARDGGAPGIFGVLRRGFLRRERVVRDGRRTLLGLVVPGSILGDPSGLRTEERLEAASEAEICVFDRQAVLRMRAADPEVRILLLRDAAEQLERQRDMIWLRGALSTRERIIAFLVMAADVMPLAPQADGSFVLTVDLSRPDWAALMNTTVESISRTMSGLAEAGLVESAGRFRYRIRDLAGLAGLAGLDRRHDRV